MTGMSFAPASAALIDGLAAVAGLKLDTSELRTAADASLRQVDELITKSSEHLELVRQLERNLDATEGNPLDLGQIPTADELGAELERYLRGQRGDRERDVSDPEDSLRLNRAVTAKPRMPTSAPSPFWRLWTDTASKIPMTISIKNMKDDRNDRHLPAPGDRVRRLSLSSEPGEIDRVQPRRDDFGDLFHLRYRGRLDQLAQAHCVLALVDLAPRVGVVEQPPVALAVLVRRRRRR